jgi:small-conductance mechanosensitive channel
LSTLSKLFGEFLELINVKSIEMMGIRVLLATAIFLAALWVLRILERTIDRRIRHDNQDDEAVKSIYKSAARSIIMVPGILLAVHVLGINLSSLFTTGGLFAVALAFAMKNIAENYVAGVMLRFERTIKPGDVLETEGAMVRVKSIGLRATIVRTKAEDDQVIPNSQLVQEPVANYTLKDSICRVWTTVGVAYSSDLKKVRKTLERACDQLVGKSDQHAPEVLLTEFGSSAVNYKISIWIENPWDSGLIKSELNESIWWALQKAGIVIAYPQLDVHFDEASTRAARPEPAPIEEP